MWIYTSTSPYAFMAYCLLVKHRDNFVFYHFSVTIAAPLPLIPEGFGSPNQWAFKVAV
jgi:hypothetical protein